MRRYYGDRVCGAEPRTEVASKKATLSRTAVASDETKRAKSQRAEQRVANLEAAASKAEKPTSGGNCTTERPSIGSNLRYGTRRSRVQLLPIPRHATTVEIAAAIALLAVPAMDDATANPLAWTWSGMNGCFAATDRAPIGANDGLASAAGAVAMAGLVLVGDELPAPTLLDARIAALFVVVDETSEAPASFEEARLCARKDQAQKPGAT